MHFHFGKEGGAERFFVHLANALDTRGVEQRAVIRPGRSWRYDLPGSMEVIENNFRNLSPARILLRPRVMAWAKRVQPQAMLAWAPRASEFMPPYPGAIRISRLGDYPKKLDYFRYTDCIVCNTPGIAEHVRSLGWRRGLRVISNFTKVEAVSQVDRAQLETPDEVPLIVSMGRFVARKGFDVLIRAVARLPEHHLWLLGNGEEEQALKTLAARLGVADRVRFAGWQPDPRPFIAAADCFALSSNHEPLGNVVLEAWAQDVPVVSTRCEGPMWFMSDSANGLLVDIGDEAAFAGAFARLRSEPSLSARLVQGGKKTLQERFSEQAITDAYLELFAMSPESFR